MTSEEIKQEKSDCSSDPGNIARWLAEIAYQLAVMNERQAEAQAFATEVCKRSMQVMDDADAQLKGLGTKPL